MSVHDIENWVIALDVFPWKEGVANLQRRLQRLTNFELQPKFEKVNAGGGSSRRQRKSISEEELQYKNAIYEVLQNLDEDLQYKIVRSLYTDFDPQFPSKEKIFENVQNFLTEISNRRDIEFERIKNILHSACINTDTCLEKYREIMEIQMDYYKFQERIDLRQDALNGDGSVFEYSRISHHHYCEEVRELCRSWFENSEDNVVIPHPRGKKVTFIDANGDEERVLLKSMGPGHTSPLETHRIFKDHEDFGERCIELCGKCPAWMYLESFRPRNVVYSTDIETCANEKVVPMCLNFFELRDKLCDGDEEKEELFGETGVEFCLRDTCKESDDILKCRNDDCDDCTWLGKLNNDFFLSL
jgi:hypothetical protein